MRHLFFCVAQSSGIGRRSRSRHLHRSAITINNMNMKSFRSRRRRRRDSILALSFLCSSALNYSVVLSLIVNPRNILELHSGNNLAERNFFVTKLRPRTGTKLRNNDDAMANDDDFASFNNLGRGESDEGRRLAREFYRELQSRKGRSPSSSGKVNNYEDIRTGLNSSNDYDSRAARLQASWKGGSMMHDKKGTLAKESSQSSQESLSPLLSFLSFFSPTPRPAASAGLFSGSGTTVYSSGRSIRAEIEILETTLKRNGDHQNKRKGACIGSTPQQSDEAFRVAVALIIVLSVACVIVASSGGMTEVTPWNGATASTSNVMSLMNDATKSNVMISLRQGNIVMDEAAWLTRQSSDWSTHVVEAVRYVEELVLR